MTRSIGQSINAVTMKAIGWLRDVGPSQMPVSTVT